ncbi:Tau-tubulin kinase [Dirofilaria immitis]
MFDSLHIRTLERKRKNLREKIDQWTVVEKLGEGGFGSVYKVSKGNEVYALKTESLKEKVKDMRKKLPGQKFSMVCALSVGIQCLEAIEELHTIGFLHRDIKPSNYATGRGKLSELRRIYILDFGMCRSYLDEHGRFRPPRKTAGFRGTVRYASLSSHIRRETCRKDDIESWLYQQIEVTRGALPWCSLDDKKDDVAMFKISQGIYDDIYNCDIGSTSSTFQMSYNEIRGTFASESSAVVSTPARN